MLGNLNSGPYVCVAGTLLTESLTAPAPSLAILFALLGAWFPSYYPRLNILQTVKWGNTLAHLYADNMASSPVPFLEAEGHFPTSCQ